DGEQPERHPQKHGQNLQQEAEQPRQPLRQFHGVTSRCLQENPSERTNFSPYHRQGPVLRQLLRSTADPLYSACQSPTLGLRFTSGFKTPPPGPLPEAERASQKGLSPSPSRGGAGGGVLECLVTRGAGQRLAPCFPTPAYGSDFAASLLEYFMSEGPNSPPRSRADPIKGQQTAGGRRFFHEPA